VTVDHELADAVTEHPLHDALEPRSDESVYFASDLDRADVLDDLRGELHSSARGVWR
jgi:hypothetical protein